MPPKRYFDDRGSTSAAAKFDNNDDSTIIDQSIDEIGNESQLSSSTNTKRQRKKKDSTTPHIQTTLFISSLPFTATSTDLTTLFSDIGPLRRAFVVTEKETGKSKGVGYVTFAIHEDAKSAIEKLQGHSLDGKRKMRIEWATGRFGEVNAAETSQSQTQEENGVSEKTQKSTSSSSSDRDPDAVRTIIMTGLGECKPSADNKSIYKRARKIGDVENVIYPAPSSILSTNLSNDVAHIVYRTPNHAMTAVEKLHAHVFKSAQISVVLKKRADGAAKLDAHMRPETKAKRDALKRKVEEEEERDAKLNKSIKKDVNENDLKPEINRGSRLIIRNLPFDVTDRDLRAIFLPFGPIYSIDVPQKATPAKNNESEADVSEKVSAEQKMDVDEAHEEGEDVSTKSKLQGKGRGFAFVWHVSRNDASNAINGVNGTSIGHGAAEKAQLKAAKGKAGRETAKKALEEVNKTAQPARQVAVDWALSKKEWELKKDESEAGDTDVEDVNDEDEEDEEDEDEDEDEDEGDSSPVEAESDEEDEDEEAKPSLPKPEEGTTLFIRNLPYQATEEELRDLFRSFGPLRYAKLTMDKITKRPKGTAFICFWQKESAEKALQQSRLVEQEVGSTGNSSSQANKKKINPFSASSILTADPSAPLTASLSLHGRVLSIVEAVERTEANDLANASQNARNKSDKRNTYLMREGVPMPGTPLAEKLNEAEIDRRLANFQMRKVQLTKNPSLYISKTRLSVRQLPLFVTDKVLKKLAEYAVKTFDEQVESGQRQALTTDELQESRKLAMEMSKNENAANKALAHYKDNDDEESNEKSKKQQLKLKRKSALQRRRMTNKGGFVVAQSKIIRAKDRLDQTLGLGRSHGYGFIEMVTFADALKCVRMANANSSLRKLMISWYVEELKEILQKMKKESTSPEKKKDDEFIARMKRIERKISQLEAGQIDIEEEGTRGGLLVVEFSIENIVTVKRRSERERNGKAKNSRDRNSTTTSRDVENGRGERTRLGKRTRQENDDSQSGPSSKKPKRPATWNQKTKKGSTKQPFVQPTETDNGYGNRLRSQNENKTTTQDSKPTKQGSLFGSIIGRKRKMRQGKK